MAVSAGTDAGEVLLVRVMGHRSWYCPPAAAFRGCPALAGFSGAAAKGAAPEATSLASAIKRRRLGAAQSWSGCAAGFAVGVPPVVWLDVQRSLTVMQNHGQESCADDA